jgi:hypothetical protein
MADLPLPDLSRLTLQTDATDEAGRSKFKISRAPKALQRLQQAAQRKANEEQAEAATLQRDRDHLERAGSWVLEKNAEKKTTPASAELALASQKLDAVGASVQRVTDAKQHAENYKRAMDDVATTFPMLRSTGAWRRLIQDYVDCLKKAANVLLDVATNIQSDLMTRVDLKRERYARMSKVLTELLTEDHGTWRAIVAQDVEYVELRDRAKREAKGALDLMDSAPEDRVERELWLQDLKQVILEAQKEQREGTTSLSREVDAFRRTKNRRGMTQQQISDALEPPKLSAHMQLIYDAVVAEMRRLEGVVDEKRMRRNTYIQESIDFSSFGLGVALIRYTVSQSELDPRPRKNLNLKWFPPDRNEPYRVKRLLHDATPTLPVSADTHLRSKRELVRFLFWLDSTLTDAQRKAAKTWTELKPRVDPTEEGVSV